MRCRRLLRFSFVDDWQLDSKKREGWLAFAFFVEPAGQLHIVQHAFAMKIVRSIPAMQRLATKWQREGLRVSFVPTMGFLHAGHLSLIKRAGKLAGKDGKVVVSLFVNPTQFGPNEDFSRYPRDFKKDVILCRSEGVDVLFAPTREKMYPNNSGGEFSTYVAEDKLSRTMEGASRPTHFRGVTTIVCKLFNIVRPTVAVFGAKDFQQAAIVKRMARDLNFPIKIVIAPIHREPDGLAMSSRNQFLTGDLRSQSVILWECIQYVRRRLGETAKPLPAARLKRAVEQLVEKVRAARLDYVEFFDPESLIAVRRVSRGTQMALAVFVGNTRLIDNCRL